MALVVGSQASEKRSAAVGEAKIPVERLDEEPTRCVYCRVYDESGEVVSKTSFNEDDTSLGRMETFSIPPPHTVASLESCITKAEGIPGRDLQMFEDEEGEVTMEDDNTIALLTGAYPGIVEDEPIVVVYESQKKVQET